MSTGHTERPVRQIHAWGPAPLKCATGRTSSPVETTRAPGSLYFYILACVIFDIFIDSLESYEDRGSPVNWVLSHDTLLVEDGTAKTH